MPVNGNSYFLLRNYIIFNLEYIRLAANFDIRISNQNEVPSMAHMVECIDGIKCVSDFTHSISTFN